MTLRHRTSSSKRNRMESDLLCFVVLFLPQIWGETQFGLEIVNVRDNLTLKSSRQVRKFSTKMKESEKREVIRIHNLYRSMVVPSAADMEYMEWDDRLADISQEWAENCQFKHGNPKHNFPHGVGQNLYKGSIHNVSFAMKLFFEEYEDYDYYGISCKPGKKCGHYTQIVWSTSRYVGCGITDHCWRDYKYYIVCNYWPPGNYVGKRPYLEGRPCTHCNLTRSGLCSGKSCVTRSQCNKKKLNCACDLQCYNCGELDREKCKCKCKDGWTSYDCSVPCVDLKKGKCSVYDCWDFQLYSNHSCVKSCSGCKGVDKSNLENTCCDGVLCPFGEVYDPSYNRPCVCVPLCPGPKCGSIFHGPHFLPLIIALLLSEYCRP